MKPGEKAWLPDLLLADGRLQSGVALVADAAGRIVRLSRGGEDLAQAERLRDRALLPGFVNAHSHAFQRALRGRTEYRTRAAADTFWTWREGMYRAARRLSPEGVYAVARACFLEMALAGITCVGEFHYLHHQPDGSPYPDTNRLAKEVVRAARSVGLRIALLQTGYARAGWNRPAHPGQARFLYRRVDDFLAQVEALRSDLAGAHRGDEAWVGVAPHSLRAVTLEDFRRIAGFGRERGMPVHLHVSEQRGENEDCLKEYGATPVELLAGEGLLGPDFTGIHGVHLSDSEIVALGLARATICACPTTERNLGDGTVPADRLLAAGANLAFGTDSQIQIGLHEDARELDYHLRLKREERVVLGSAFPRGDDPDGLAAGLLACAAAGGARALNAPGGELESGRTADFFTVDLRDPALTGLGHSVGALLFGLERAAIRDVAVGGRLVVQEGRHPEQRAILEAFEAVQTELWAKP